jgi:hypothetical protein
MSRRFAQPVHDPGAPIEAIDPADLASVTGGRITPRTSLDPVLLQGIGEIAKAIMSVGQSLAAAKEASSSQMMQMIQKMMEQRRG